MLLRPNLSPELIVLGSFDEVGESHIRAEAIELDRTCRRLQYINYAEVEDACQILARHLAERFSESELSRFQFTSIPRGGHIVLGMLAYALQLRRPQLEMSAADTPLVVVDDCALTGLRFHQFLGKYRHRQVVFTPLYSHPDLRSSVESEEANVLACLSGRDLHDYGPQQSGDRYPGWQQRWLAKLEGHRYWAGQIRHLCLPWNEPDRLLWNPVTQRAEIGWRVVPPELCLGNRGQPYSNSVNVQIQHQPPGPLRPPDQVFFCRHNDQIVVGDLNTGGAFGLADVAGQMWNAIVEQGSCESALDELSQRYDVSASRLKVDLEAFVEDLSGRGLLEERFIPERSDSSQSQG